MKHQAINFWMSPASTVPGKIDPGVKLCDVRTADAEGTHENGLPE